MHSRPPCSRRPGRCPCLCSVRPNLHSHPPEARSQKRPTLTANGSSDLPHVLEVRSDVLASGLGDCLSAPIQHDPSVPVVPAPRCKSTHTSPGCRQRSGRKSIGPALSVLPRAVHVGGAHHVERCFCGVNEKALLFEDLEFDEHERASEQQQRAARQPASQSGRQRRSESTHTVHWAQGQAGDGRWTPNPSGCPPASAVGRTLRPACQTLRCLCLPANPLQSGINSHVKVHFGFQSHGVSRCLLNCRVAGVSPPSNISSAPAKVDSRLTVRSSRLLRLPRLPVLRSAFTGLLDSDKNIDMGCI